MSDELKLSALSHWILSDDDPPREIAVDDVLVWARWFEENDGRRFIRNTQIRRGEVEGPWVSTVFIGLDLGMGWLHGGPPLVYETMVFTCRNEWHEPSELFPDGHWGVGDDIAGEKHSTWAEAMLAHERMVEEYGERWWAEHGDQETFGG